MVGENNRHTTGLPFPCEASGARHTRRVPASPYRVKITGCAVFFAHRHAPQARQPTHVTSTLSEKPRVSTRPSLVARFPSVPPLVF